MAIRTLDDLTVEGTTVGVRVDINSPLDGRELADDARLQAHVGTLSELLDRGGRVVVLAHQGRPGGAEFSDLAPHADRLGTLLGERIEYVDGTFSANAREAISALATGEGLVLENTRFYSEEYMEFDPDRAAETYLVARLAPVLDAYVNDAFAAAHRSQPSLVGFPCVLPGYAGRTMERELAVLGGLDDGPTPRVFLLGGAKVVDSLEVAESVLERELADAVLAAGVVGNAFLLAAGVNLGAASASIVAERSREAVTRAGDILDTYGERIHLPRDVAIERGGERTELDVEALPAESAAMDVGAKTISAFGELLEEAGTAVLNGPVGVFEDDRFSLGTAEIYTAATRAEHSVVGGGDTAAALRQLEVTGFDHVSTGGGAALRMLCGEPLPAVEALRSA